MRPLVHPSVEDITVEAILHALSDPARVAIFAQGWLFGRPVPIDQFVSLLNASTDGAVREWVGEEETEFALPVGAM